MSTDQFLAEIRIFPFNFAPTGWAFCDGQIMPIAQNTALFALLGTTYGGNGQTTFALPNLQGRVARHAGQGQGLSSVVLEESGGTETVTLLQSEIPQHSHGVFASQDPGNQVVPSVNRSLGQSTGGALFAMNNPPLSAMAFESLSLVGGSLPHTNMQPYLTLNFCIALQGIFPPR